MIHFLELNEIISSSSSSESEQDLINIIEENDDRQRRKIPRIQNFIETVVYEYNETEFQANFRYVNIELICIS